jgi:hypothetical protein
MKALEELLPLLDGLLDALQRKLDAMREMRQCVVAGNVRGLDELMRDRTDLESVIADLAGRMEQARSQIAPLAGAAAGEVKLSRLVQEANGPLGIALSDRRERLLTVVEALRRESALLSRLVRHTMELNACLLAALAGVPLAGETYSRDGSVERTDEVTIFPTSV